MNNTGLIFQITRHNALNVFRKSVHGPTIGRLGTFNDNTIIGIELRANVVDILRECIFDNVAGSNDKTSVLDKCDEIRCILNT